MKVLVACEFSGVVRSAFRARGHDAFSCDILPAEDNSLYHFKADIFQVLDDSIRDRVRWDLMIAHPPCTYLARSGARWWPNRQQEQADAIEFVRRLLASAVPKICVENPIGRLSTTIGKPTQIIQPWQHGHGETKATCLWLKGLQPLVPSEIVDGRRSRVHLAPDSKDRWKNRSRTLPGIARAMAEQWSPDAS